MELQIQHAITLNFWLLGVPVNAHSKFTLSWRSLLQIQPIHLMIYTFKRGPGHFEKHFDFSNVFCEAIIIYFIPFLVLKSMLKYMISIQIKHTHTSPAVNSRIFVLI